VDRLFYLTVVYSYLVLRSSKPEPDSQSEVLAGRDERTPLFSGFAI
jgi:hypothetical protein